MVPVSFTVARNFVFIPATASVDPAVAFGAGAPARTLFSMTGVGVGEACFESRPASGTGTGALSTGLGCTTSRVSEISGDGVGWGSGTTDDGGVTGFSAPVPFG